MTSTALIFGAGPAACWTAHALVARGVKVKAVNRSGQRPSLMPATVTMVAADVADAQQAIAAAQGAQVVIQALNPPYSQWASLFPTLHANTVLAAEQAGARYVALENLYMLDCRQPMIERSPAQPRSTKGQVRQAMHHDLMQRHQQGRLQVAAVRAADFYGPGVTVSAMGQMALGRLAQGKTAQLMGQDHLLHSYAYIKDVGLALATVAFSQDPAVWGHTWLAPHAPAITQAELVQLAAPALGHPPKWTCLAPWMIRMAGWFNADAKASLEMQYQFQETFVVDSSLSNAQLGLQATPLATGVQDTMAWYGLEISGRR